MSFDLKIRNYKDAKPSSTINNIRNILCDLDCFIYETVWSNLYEGMYSVRIENLNSFGTNGKGRNREFALASAYGEFMERIQNNLHTGAYAITRAMFQKIKEETGYYVYPDEIAISKDDFLKLPEKFLTNLETETNCKINTYVDLYFDRLYENGYMGVLSVPFYDVKNDKVIYFPYNILQSMTGSNGMCGGNSNQEALFQGICELLERYSAYEIYHKRLTPPDISRDFLSKFCPEEFELIEKVEKSGKYEIIIKDFSAGKRLPCIASMVIDKENKKYRLNVGCDTHFKIALSRTLTELFQGVHNEDFLNKMTLPIPEVEYEYFLEDDLQSVQKRNSEFVNFTRNGTGVFPFSLFGKEADYAFDPTIFDGDNSYDYEVKKLITFVISLDFDIYIRNVSFLGFPAFHIYCPFLSTYGKKNTDSRLQNTLTVNRTIAVDKIENLFFPIKKISDEKIKNLLPILENGPSAKMKNLLKLNFSSDNIWDVLPVNYFLILFNYLLGNYEKCLEYLKIFIEEFNLENDEYYVVLNEFIINKINGLTHFEIEKLLSLTYNSSIVSNVLFDFENRNRIFEGIQMPNCPDCINCEIKDNCKTKELVDLSIRIINFGKKQSIYQNELCKYTPII